MRLGWAPIPRDWRPYEKSWCGHAQGDRRPVQRGTPCAPWGEGSTCAGARDRGPQGSQQPHPAPRPAGSGTARQELAVVPAAGLYHLVAAAPRAASPAAGVLETGEPVSRGGRDQLRCCALLRSHQNSLPCSHRCRHWLRYLSHNCVMAPIQELFPHSGLKLPEAP